MKTRVAFLLVAGALAGLAVAATKPSAKSTRAEATTKARRAKATSSGSAIVRRTNPPAQSSDTNPVDATRTSPEAVPADSASPAPAKVKPSELAGVELGDRDVEFLFTA